MHPGIGAVPTRKIAGQSLSEIILIRLEIYSFLIGRTGSFVLLFRAPALSTVGLDKVHGGWRGHRDMDQT